MYEKQILSVFEDKILVTTNDIRTIIAPDNRAVLNTEIKRLCDKNQIVRVGKGIYARPKCTKWGNVLPTEYEVVMNYYLNVDNGYISDVTYLNRIGLTTLMSNRLFVTSNKYRCKLNVLKRAVIKRPKTKITKENVRYLQLLDGIESYFENHCDAPNPDAIFMNEIRKQHLRGTVLIVLAKKYYTKKVFDYLLGLEEKLYDEFTFRSRGI